MHRDLGLLTFQRILLLASSDSEQCRNSLFLNYLEPDEEGRYLQRNIDNNLLFDNTSFSSRPESPATSF